MDGWMDEARCVILWLSLVPLLGAIPYDPRGAQRGPPAYFSFLNTDCLGTTAFKKITRTSYHGLKGNAWLDEFLWQ